MKLKAVESHQSSYPDPIHFGVGEAVIIGRTDEEFPGWNRCRTADGNEVWAPMEFLNMTGDRTAIATAGDILEGLNELKGWIWRRDRDGAEGWVPAKTLKPV